nr:metal-sensitive transcriptional regulator [Propionibacterium sp.]
MLSPEELSAVRHRLRRVQGQVGAIVGMLEEGRACGDVVHVLAAATAALNKTGYLLLNHAMRQCLTDPTSTPADLAKLEKLFLELA